MKTKDLEKLDAYFMKNLGITTKDFLEFEGNLNNTIVAQTSVMPEKYAYYIWFGVTILKGTKIKIQQEKINQPLGYSNDIKFKVLNSPIELPNEFEMTLEDLVKVLK